MRLLAISLTILTLTCQAVSGVDLRGGVPTDVYLVTYHLHNPERDYQRKYMQRTWETIEETQIVERFFQAIQNRMSDDEFEKFEDVRETLTDALEPIQWDALVQAEEVLYAQKMAVPTSQHLLLLRLPEHGASSLSEGIVNLIELAEETSSGRVTLETESINGVELTWLQLPEEVPFAPSVAVLDDVLLFSSRHEFARESIELLNNPDATTKFDDDRLAMALDRLPQYEDGLTFFDGQALFRQLGGISDFIRDKGREDEGAMRAADLFDTVIGEVQVLDFEVTVDYTEGYQNRQMVYGQIVPEARETVLGQMFLDQQPFEDWSRWVPNNATSYSLQSGASLHPVYTWLMEVLPEKIPEIRQGLAQFDAFQNAIDLHIDEDILQAFSGESVSISLPGATASPFGMQGQSAVFLKCDQPDRIHELLHRLVGQLQQIPQLESQNIDLIKIEGREQFEEISAGVFAVVGIRPVIGFHEDWMVIASHIEAVDTILNTLEGQGTTLADTEAFQKFNIETDGPVSSIGYRNIGEGIRSASVGMQQAGAMLPMILGMAAQNGAEISEAQEFLALIPSVGRIVGTLDFFEEQVSVTQPGPNNLSYTRQTVTTIRPPEEESN